jgi:iron complex outermembrane receptor protein
MKFQKSLLAGAVLSTFGLSAYAQTAQTNQAAQPPAHAHFEPDDPSIPKVIVTASPFANAERDQILAPARVLAGDELREKLGNSIGDTLSGELGVSSSGFGSAAARPIIRGLEGARVKVLENGMTVADVSGLSNDHAVSAEGANARQVEILRGPAALLYGSGAIGGLVNVVNERIPTALEPRVTGQVEARGTSVDSGQLYSGSLDIPVTAAGVGLHIDASRRRADDFRIPGNRFLHEADDGNRRLPSSSVRKDTWGMGAAVIRDWGYAGISTGRLDNLYGVPTTEGTVIDQYQRRYDFDSRLNAPLAGLEFVRVRAGYTDYRHSELDEAGAPEITFKQKDLETRVELGHAPIGRWHGIVGLQTERTDFAALSEEEGPDTVPETRSTSRALFVVEESDLGPLHVNAGARTERVERRPLAGPERDFSLLSYSVGGLYPLGAYGVGATISVAERAPAIEELYSAGPHEATETFDIGNPDFRKERSRNLELYVQKRTGLVRWKANLFHNRVDDYVYGRVDGTRVDEAGEPGEDLLLRRFEQGDARLRGAEAELTYNQYGQGWLGRLFADYSQGRLVRGGTLPLQPAKRVGLEVTYRSNGLRSGLTVLHAARQDRLASFETSVTPAFTQVNLHLSYRQRFAEHDLTWFVLVNNALDRDIRLSTSLLRDVAPQPGRNVVWGVRAKL